MPRALPRSFSTTLFSAWPRDEHHAPDSHSEHHQGAHTTETPSSGRSTRGDSHIRDAAQQFTDLPPPIPDSGLRTSLSLLSFSRTTLLPFAATRSSSTMIAESLPLLSATLTVSDAVSKPSALSVSLSSTVHTPSASGTTTLQNKSSNPSKIPVAAIVSVAVGVGFLVFAGFIFLRVCARPRRRDRPKPSLPILDDPYPEDIKANESPLFGGKERFSSNTGSGGGLWTWTQYPRVRSTELPTVQLFPPSPSPAAPESDSYPSLPRAVVPSSRGLLAPRPPPSQSVPTLGNSLLSVTSSRQATAANSTTSLDRLSAKSISLYPSTPSINEGATRFNTRRVSGTDEPDEGRENAYDGADITSPQFLAQDLTEECPASPLPSGGRSRIKSSYFSYTPGSYPRMSSVQSGLGMSSKVHDDEFDLKKLPPIHKSDSAKSKNKALASAIGMTSPDTLYTTPLSPRPSTLYPDDSLSMADAKRSSRRLQRKPTPKQIRKSALPMDTGTLRAPTLDSATALGSFMLMEFGATSKSSGILSSETVPGTQLSSSKGLTGKGIGPPRVPSPPALPTLAQMGLEHANPEAYAEYRSATYSIFGLYEGDRKSRLG
ncbi:hypothetical protein PM082_013163 [Marasmius tenuissimus]|nr:hypothetical protein PM082_013163 [Marasmius tenuissimus]